ncbi:Equilibrative Nucleoside Transporter (ENT) Family [Achlya hypogyna]|uniref:Equilibrative Nucleoside Transporter (ENT) Family n=1 Tax=Achlya hypogyna TaxID=1202772 RepID=A0A1V9YM79_ACHHY|nr:Equilibrative Nucleoside Transporter (ENT) Family [Achlya hypogyna]
MDSPNQEQKQAKLLVNGSGADEIPDDVLTNIQQHRRFIWWSLLFLNGSCLWAYYSCLSAQSYYNERFKDTPYKFEYLTTLFTTWPMFIGHFFQIVFGLDKKLGFIHRIHIGYSVFILCALAIILQDVCDASPKAGAIIVLIAFVVVGLMNSLTEAGFYALSSLFPDAIFTDAVQMGNGTSGIINVTFNTLLLLVVGGTDPAPKDKQNVNKIACYIFFGVFVVVCIAALYVFHRLLRIPGVQHLMERNDAETARRVAEKETYEVMWARLGRITRAVTLPLVCLVLIFLCSLTAFPGIGISSGFQLAGGATWGNWYINGVLLSYNYGDFFGRLVANKLYRFFTLQSVFVWSIVRWGLFVLLLMGLPGNGQNPLFAMANAHDFNIFWQLFVTAVIGVTNGVLSTIAIGLGPRLVAQDDRESAGAILCLALFFGISSGATVGWQFGVQHWLGA